VTELSDLPEKVIFIEASLRKYINSYLIWQYRIPILSFVVYSNETANFW